MTDKLKPAAFSNVGLTIISIIVALGIEHLLGHVSALVPGADREAAFLIVAQGVTTFIVIGTIWLAYAIQLMTAGWEPRFHDFYTPLLILTLLYFWISAIGSSGSTWFYISAIGFGIAALENRFGLPDPVAEQLQPGLPMARYVIFTTFGICLLALATGLAMQLGTIDTTGATLIACLMAVGQLFAAWSHYKWWRHS